MNFDDIIVPSVTAGLGSFITWIFGRKKENVEIQGSEITNTQEAVKIWREMAQELSDKVKDLTERIDVLTEEVHQLKIENNNLKLQVVSNNESK
jgi:uncharacterized small protein (DUF1192 family)